MKNIFVYTGRGAYYLKDMTRAFDAIGQSFSKIDESGILGGALKLADILLMPGGWPQKYSSNLGEAGFTAIRSFVETGGRYIGICAGAYLASKSFSIDGSFVKGLGIAEIEAVNETDKILPGKMRKIEIVNGLPLSKGCGKNIAMWYENGPMIKASEVDVVARFENGSAAIVSTGYGKGSVILFSPHPEGSISGGADPGKLGTLCLLRNAIQ